MAAFEVEQLGKEFQVVVTSSNEVFTQEQTKAVDSIWELAVKEYPQLFNGQFFNFENFSNQKLYGRFLEYKYFYASTVDHDLRNELKIVPVGVTGVTQCLGKKLIGRRSDSVTLYKGMFEFVPAGSLDAKRLVNGEVNLEGQFADELEEEAGITSEYIESINPFLLVRDNTDNLVEIFANIQLSDSGIQSALEQSKEYTELLWLDDDAMQNHFSQQFQNYVPTVQYLLSR